jgi:hypothetical protein
MQCVMSILSIAAVVVLSGCGPMRFTQSAPWAEQPVDKAFAECKAELMRDAANAANPLSNGLIMRDQISNCMAGRGWARAD